MQAQIFEKFFAFCDVFWSFDHRLAIDFAIDDLRGRIDDRHQDRALLNDIGDEGFVGITIEEKTNEMMLIKLRMDLVCVDEVARDVGLGA